MRNQRLLFAAPFSIALSAVASLAAVAGAQSSTPIAAPAPPASSPLPATEPTGPQPSTGAISPSQLPSATPATAAHPCRSTVLWDGTTLQVDTSNCELNTLLRQVADKTGTTLSGTAPDERIFGKYGPGTLDLVLTNLLEGVPVNVLLVNRSGSDRKELLLSARSGRPSPPSPEQREDPSSHAANGRFGGAYGASRAEFNAAQQSGSQQSGSQTSTPQQTNTQPSEQGTPQPAQSANPQAPGANQPASPNGVKTPQEIFEQLQRLRTQANQ